MISRAKENILAPVMWTIQYCLCPARNEGNYKRGIQDKQTQKGLLECSLYNESKWNANYYWADGKQWQIISFQNAFLYLKHTGGGTEE